MRLFLSLIALVLLFACSSIPMSSLLKLATMDESDLLRVNPSEIRVRVSLIEPYRLAADKVELVLSFEYADNSHQEYKYALQLLDSQHTESVVSWFTQQQAKNIYRFKLTALSQLEYNRFKQTNSSLLRPKRYEWRVNYWLDPVPQNNSHIGLDLELKLSKQQDFFYLLKNAEMKVEVNTQ